MPRQPRAIADSGIYHVMMRGCGKQIIFEDDLDRETFLRLAAAKLGSNDVLVLAWCLMDNHVHFLLEDLELAAVVEVQGHGDGLRAILQRPRGPCRPLISRQVQKQGGRERRLPASGNCIHPQQPCRGRHLQA